MSIIRCARGHYYDNIKFSQCPHCGVFFMEEEDKTMALDFHSSLVMEDDGDDRTVALQSADTYVSDSNDEKTVSYYDNSAGVEEDDKTISSYVEEKGTDFLTGWLVCVKGPERGRDYRLHQGFNRIGRDYSMDVAVMEDDSISREPVCAIVYDDKSNAFFAVQQSGADVFFNGTLLQGAVMLKDGSSFRIGESEFVFIAFCKEGCVWE